MDYPEILSGLIKSFSQFPSIGKKSAERLALFTITKMSDDEKDEFIKLLNDTKNIKKCICGNITFDDECEICKNEKRDKTKIMVVEDIKDVLAIEQSGYNGMYHILGGVINFSNGITIENLNISNLFKRLSGVNEVILALSLTTEGEMTSNYIKSKINECLVTRIAYGIPAGGNINYADEYTLKKALEGRREF